MFLWFFSLLCFVSLSFPFLFFCPSCLPFPVLLIFNETFTTFMHKTISPRGASLMSTSQRKLILGHHLSPPPPPRHPPHSFIWAGPPHQSPFKYSRNTAANWAGGGGSVAETEGVFGDLVALGFWGGTSDLGLDACRHTPLTCKLKLITLSFTKLLSVSTSIQKGEKICPQFLS